ncbi:MAG: tRNA (adenosine(37)-N6)-threonylcarbamoyltransferase complex ATPase subunit type 1 TsaE [Anaerolineae bacterium]|nr:tRNA (adenosine(37)-N6)-threonylcarbamoyltransferase complex ATPase subunit type 1 TsaE [Anaerolineae bacterium]
MAILDAKTIEFTSNSAEQTRRLGMRLGGLLQRGACICLNGNLGAGKTTFVQGLAAGWGSSDPVTSPTFVLVNQYERLTGGMLYHLDAYRLANSLEAEDLDLTGMMEDGVLVVEWPERIDEALPADRLWVDLTYVSEGKRHLVFQPVGETYVEILNAFRKRTFGGV